MKIFASMCAFIFTGGFVVSDTDYFALRRGLGNSKQVFESTGMGRVVFLGGSITFMSGWRDMVCAELERRFPETKFDFINAGIPSTGSTPGAYRLARDVFKNGPVDLIFEEAAVNDFYNGRSDKEQIRGMEGIVRHAQNINPNIDIILMHFVDPEKIKEYNNGEIPAVIQNHERVAVHYNLPSINFALEVTERINREEFSWENDFKDKHPSPFGHQLYFRTITRLFEFAWVGKSIGENGRIETYYQPEKLDDFCYDTGMLLSPDNVEKVNGFTMDPKWENTVGGATRPGFVNVPMLVGKNPGDSFEFSFVGSAVGLFVIAGPDSGSVEYRINNGKWQKQDLYTKWSQGLHIPWIYMLEAELEKEKKHRLEVRLLGQKNRQSQGYSCRIVNFVINAYE